MVTEHWTSEKAQEAVKNIREELQAIVEWLDKEAKKRRPVNSSLWLARLDALIDWLHSIEGDIPTSVQQEMLGWHWDQGSVLTMPETSVYRMFWQISKRDMRIAPELVADLIAGRGLFPVTRCRIASALLSGERVTHVPVSIARAFLEGKFEHRQDDNDMGRQDLLLSALHPGIPVDEVLELIGPLDLLDGEAFAYILASHGEEGQAWLAQHHPALVGMPTEWIGEVLDAEFDIASIFAYEGWYQAYKSWMGKKVSDYAALQYVSTGQQVS